MLQHVIFFFTTKYKAMTQQFSYAEVRAKQMFYAACCPGHLLFLMCLQRCWTQVNASPHPLHIKLFLSLCLRLCARKYCKGQGSHTGTDHISVLSFDG